MQYGNLPSSFYIYTIYEYRRISTLLAASADKTIHCTLTILWQYTVIYSICADIFLQVTIYCTFRFNPLVLRTQLLHMLARIANASILSRVMHHRNPSSAYKQIYVRSRANPLFVYSAVQNPVLIVGNTDENSVIKYGSSSHNCMLTSVVYLSTLP